MGFVVAAVVVAVVAVDVVVVAAVDVVVAAAVAGVASFDAVNAFVGVGGSVESGCC